MDSQSLINALMGLAGFFGGWTINSLTKAIAKIEDRLQEMPDKYVAKDDYKDDIKSIHEMLNKIFDKLDGKADKS